MIDGLTKHVLDPIWGAAATPLVRAGLTPNQVTLAGLALVVLTSICYLWHQSAIWFGLTLAMAFAFDALDGAVARRRGMQSKVGGYLDAVVDRYQELTVLAALSWVHDLWALGLAVFSGCILTSYAKARTALEIPVSNEAWPDLMERLERIIFLSLLLIGAGILGWLGFDTGLILAVGLFVMAILTHLTALQRMRRAFRLLRLSEEGELGAANEPSEVDQIRRPENQIA